LRREPTEVQPSGAEEPSLRRRNRRRASRFCDGQAEEPIEVRRRREGIDRRGTAGTVVMPAVIMKNINERTTNLERRREHPRVHRSWIALSPQIKRIAMKQLIEGYRAFKAGRWPIERVFLENLAGKR